MELMLHHWWDMGSMQEQEEGTEWLLRHRWDMELEQDVERV